LKRFTHPAVGQSVLLGLQVKMDVTALAISQGRKAA
jgi:hypothetical protein